ncbi:MAG TPA: PAC2 family protein [Gemmataceae bacterium]|nr:PAC2 family protein [Gemmataceae bacterium]
MPDKVRLDRPWLVAVWPGMGHVALNAGVYLLAKLGMSLIAEFQAGDLFDVDYVEVKEGIIQTGRRPRNRLFLWTDPKQKHDLVVFIGEAQPPIGKYAFCRQLLAHVRQLGVERVFTFAAMATQMHPEQRSRVFGAATDRESLEELRRLELAILEDGQIGGLNGVLLGAAAEQGLRGACLLGEMPHFFSQLPFPKASLAILEVFATIAGIDLDLTELAEQARAMDKQLGELLAQMEKAYGAPESAEEEEYTPEPAERERLTPADKRRIEELFKQAAKDRSKAFELKQELDRLGVFKEYEDRFLDLFKKPG